MRITGSLRFVQKKLLDVDVVIKSLLNQVIDFNYCYATLSSALSWKLATDSKIKWMVLTWFLIGWLVSIANKFTIYVFYCKGHNWLEDQISIISVFQQTGMFYSIATGFLFSWCLPFSIVSFSWLYSISFLNFLALQ